MSAPNGDPENVYYAMVHHLHALRADLGLDDCYWEGSRGLAWDDCKCLFATQVAAQHGNEAAREMLTKIGDKGATHFPRPLPSNPEPQSSTSSGATILTPPGSVEDSHAHEYECDCGECAQDDVADAIAGEDASSDVDAWENSGNDWNEFSANEGPKASYYDTQKKSHKSSDNWARSEIVEKATTWGNANDARNTNDSWANHGNAQNKNGNWSSYRAFWDSASNTFDCCTTSEAKPNKQQQNTNISNNDNNHWGWDWGESKRSLKTGAKTADLNKPEQTAIKNAGKVPGAWNETDLNARAPRTKIPDPEMKNLKPSSRKPKIEKSPFDASTMKEDMESLTRVMINVQSTLNDSHRRIADNLSSLRRDTWGNTSLKANDDIPVVEQLTLALSFKTELKNLQAVATKLTDAINEKSTCDAVVNGSLARLLQEVNLGIDDIASLLEPNISR